MSFLFGLIIVVLFAVIIFKFVGVDKTVKTLKELKESPLGEKFQEKTKEIICERRDILWVLF